MGTSTTEWCVQHLDLLPHFGGIEFYILEPIDSVLYFIISGRNITLRATDMREVKLGDLVAD
jgi:hypothetical protein